MKISIIKCFFRGGNNSVYIATEFCVFSYTGIALLFGDWLKNLVTHSQPIEEKSKTHEPFYLLHFVS